MSIYVYGFTSADRDAVPEGTTGVGDPPATVRTVVADDLAALVSESPDDLKPRRRDLLAHQDVLLAAGAGGAVLPLRFGALSQDEDTVRQVLERRGDYFRERLEALDGRAEYNVKAAHHEEEVLRLVLREDSELQALNERQRAQRDASYEQQLRLGEMIANAVREREIRDGRRVQEALEPYAEEVVPGPGSGESWLVNISFLVPEEGTEDFAAALQELGDELPHLELRANGPLPPYSFVEPTGGAEQAEQAGQQTAPVGGSE